MQRAFSMLALGLGLTALSSRPVLAMAPETLVVHVPFAFSVLDETLPPGDYRVRPLNDLERQVLELRSSDGRYALIALTEDAPAMSRTTKPELVFDHYGKMEFLRAVRLPEAAGAILEPSRSEIAAARAVASEHSAHGSASTVSSQPR